MAGACGAELGPSTPVETGAAAAATPSDMGEEHPATAGARGESLHVLMLNGGGRREINYRSHLRHLGSLLALLRASASAASEAITVFSSDGDDAAEDLATREPDTPPGFWLLPRAGVGRLLRPPLTYVTSTLDGVTLRPARKDALRAWFRDEGARLRPGDTLLLYVTDHGEKDAKDTANNTITLWGESLGVAELRELLATLDPGVRVVMLMSQCFGGAFASALLPASDATARAAPEATAGAAGDGLPRGNACGYFATFADRRAYGCYPENVAKEGVGHSHEFIAALARLGRFPEAQRRVLVSDRTPDVPHASSDFLLERLLRRVATAQGRDLAALADELLAEAWRDRGAWEPEIRLLDRIGESFGSFSPRSLAELDAQAGQLPEFSSRLQIYADRWRQAFDALVLENFRAFTAARPAWRARLESAKLEGLDAGARAALASELLGELVPFAGHDPERHRRLLALKRKADEAAAASYRAEVRLGVVLRMRSILTSIAGRVYVASRATADERRAFERLIACEDLRLPGILPALSAGDLEAPEAFPPLAEEQRLVEALMPAYMGIQFRPLPQSQQERHRAERGAVAVLMINPDSPAAEAGLRVSDIILGPPGAPFTEPEQVREWTMRSEVGIAKPLDVLRDGEVVRVTLRPGPYPLALPKLPGPPRIGSPAPPLKVELFPRPRALAERTPRLLFFWATWCVICKQAVPELLAYAEAHPEVEILAITDEEPATLERFFRDTREPFPGEVALDPLRLTFLDYGVSGTPSFVLVDGDGIVRHTRTGYRREQGLGIDGWTWHP